MAKAEKITLNGIKVIRDPEVQEGHHYMIDAGGAAARARYWREKMREHRDNREYGKAVECLRIAQQYEA